MSENLVRILFPKKEFFDGWKVIKIGDDNFSYFDVSCLLLLYLSKPSIRCLKKNYLEEFLSCLNLESLDDIEQESKALLDSYFVSNPQGKDRKRPYEFNLYLLKKIDKIAIEVSFPSAKYVDLFSGFIPFILFSELVKLKDYNINSFMQTVLNYYHKNWSLEISLRSHFNDLLYINELRLNYGKS